MEQLEANKWWVWMKSSGNNILGHYHHHRRLPPHLGPAPSVTKFSGIGGGGSGSSRTWEMEYSGCITSSSWPPRFYSCSFCKREFRSAQALGGHMNVHRRDRALLHQIPAAASCTTNECHDTQAHNCSIKDHSDSLVAPLCPPCPNGHRSKPKCLELKQTSKVSLSSSSSSSQNRSAVRRYGDNNEQFNAVGRKNELGCKLLRARTKPAVFTSGVALENMSRKNGMNHPPKANGAGGKEDVLICCSKRQRRSCISSSAAAGSLLPPTMSSPCPKQQRYNCSSTSQVQFGLKSSTSSASTSMVELDLELRLGDPSSL